MPIRPEWRKYYSRASGWPQVSGRIIRRDGYRCTRCGVPNYALIVRLKAASRRAISAPYVEVNPIENRPVKGKVTRVILGVAHLDRKPWHRDDANLSTMCQACHLRFDSQSHVRQARNTRIRRKDGARPLLVAALG
jgi:5-methylcytosine-specific restriction endonuclease McrA